MCGLPAHIYPSLGNCWYCLSHATLELQQHATITALASTVEIPQPLPQNFGGPNYSHGQGFNTPTSYQAPSNHGGTYVSDVLKSVASRATDSNTWET